MRNPQQDSDILDLGLQINHVPVAAPMLDHISLAAGRMPDTVHGWAAWPTPGMVLAVQIVIATGVPSADINALKKFGFLASHRGRTWARAFSREFRDASLHREIQR